MSSVHLLAASVSIFVITAAILDFRSKKIPNWITVPAAIAALLFHIFAPQGIGIGWALAGFAVGFLLLIVPWLLGGGGMGDVKLLAALGAWLGPLLILGVFGASAVLAAVMAAGVMVSGALSRGIHSTRNRYLQSGQRSSRPKPRRVIPFAIPVAISTVVILALMLIKASLPH